MVGTWLRPGPWSGGPRKNPGITLNNEKRAPGCLGDIRDEILSSSMGIIF